jgi:hypothetical protein
MRSGVASGQTMFSWHLEVPNPCFHSKSNRTLYNTIVCQNLYTLLQTLSSFRRRARAVTEKQDQLMRARLTANIFRRHMNDIVLPKKLLMR